MAWLLGGISAAVILAVVGNIAGVVYVLRKDREREWAK
jgi:hypothetical protein